MSEPPPEYLVIGHITIDYTPIGCEWGGTALFARDHRAATGARVHVLTSMPEEEVRSVLPAQIAVHNVPSLVPVYFPHEFVTIGFREQYITDVAHTLHADDLPETGARCRSSISARSRRRSTMICSMPSSGRCVALRFRDGCANGAADGHVRPLHADQMVAWAPPVECSFLSEEDIGQRARSSIFTAGSTGWWC